MPGTTSKQGLIIFRRVAAIIGEAEHKPASLIASAHVSDGRKAPGRLVAAHLGNLVGGGTEGRFVCLLINLEVEF